MAIQVGRSVVSFTIKSIDAREKLKREIEPLLNRNRVRLAVETDKNEFNRSHSNERTEVTPLLINENKEDFINGLRAREAGKSVNPPSSRGGLRNNLEGINGGLMNEA